MTDLPLGPDERVEWRFNAPLMPSLTLLTPQRRGALGLVILAIAILLWPAWQAALAAAAFILGLAVLGDLVNLAWRREGVLTSQRIFLISRLFGRDLPIWHAARAEVYFRSKMQFNRLASRRNGLSVRRLGVLDPADQAVLRAAMPRRIAEDAT